MKGNVVASKTTRRVIALSAFAAAAAAPVIAATTISASEPQSYQAYPGECLAWFGNQEDGHCLGYSQGNGVNLGTPSVGVYGPDSGSMPGGGIGVSTGPMLPGSTINRGIG